MTRCKTGLQMPKPFIIGLEASVEDSAAMTTDEVYKAVGHNTGNLAFHFAIKKILGRSIETTSLTPAGRRVESFGDIGVLPCANQVGAHSDLGKTAETVSKLDCSLVSIGLGAQSDPKFEKIPAVPDGTIRWIKEIAKRSPKGKPNISVRGPFTKQVLDHYGAGENAVVLGCPTLFINPDPRLGNTIAERAKRSSFDRVCVASAHHAWKHMTRLETSLTRIMAATDGSYIVQSPIEMIAMARGDWNGIPESTVESMRLFTAPELTTEEFKRWSFRYARAFMNISAWMEYLRSYDLVVGARIHGVMLALQAGVPGLCIAHDSRTRELCETMMVPYVMLSDVSAGIRRDQLPDLFKFDAEAFNAHRRELGAKFATFLSDNDLAPVAEFAPLLGTRAPELVG